MNESREGARIGSSKQKTVWELWQRLWDSSHLFNSLILARPSMVARPRPSTRFFSNTLYIICFLLSFFCFRKSKYLMQVCRSHVFLDNWMHILWSLLWIYNVAGMVYSDMLWCYVNLLGLGLSLVAPYWECFWSLDITIFLVNFTTTCIICPPLHIL